MISQESIQQILSRIDIIDIVGGFVKLKKRGANYLGLCPFHNEKSPSFTVSPSKEIYKCFGCGKSGNSIGFIMEHEKYGYVEALRWMAAKYNVELEETQASPEAKQKLQTVESLHIINNFAKDFFVNELFNSEEGNDIALSYLKERGFREEIIKKFQIGFDPSKGTAFAEAAVAAKYSEDLLLQTGLVVNRYDRLQDNYRERIIFPIHNQSGKILGFGARLIKKNDKAPKYINTPENEIYSKSKILFGTYFARQAIDKANECLLVEGYTDVVSLHQAGIENVVASGGTSLTIDQLRLIKKYTSNLTIIYDGDNAGIKAALRGLNLAIDEGFYVKLVLIPEKEDPDSYVNKLGATAFQEFILKEKKDFILFQLDVSLKEANQDSAKKAVIVNEIAETISRINKTEDFTRRQDYIHAVSQKLKIDEDGFNNLVNKIIRDKLSKENYQPAAQEFESDLSFPAGEVEIPIIPAGLLNNDIVNERAIIKVLIEYGNFMWNEEETVAGWLIKEIEENELDTMMHEPLLQTIYELYKKMYINDAKPELKDFLYHPDEQISALVVKTMGIPLELSPNWDTHYEGKILTRADMYKEEVLSTLQYLKLVKLRNLMIENENLLQEATNEEEQLLYLQTHQHLKALEKELTSKTGTVILKL